MVSVSAKKVLKKISCLCTFKSHNALVLELTVPEEEPIGSLMRIIPPITGLVTGIPAAEPIGEGGGADNGGGRANRKPYAYYPTYHRPCYRDSCR
jgi:hypothetical protein